MKYLEAVQGEGKGSEYQKRSKKDLWVSCGRSVGHECLIKVDGVGRICVHAHVSMGISCKICIYAANDRTWEDQPEFVEEFEEL